MKVFRSEEEYNLGSCVAALGTFDGLHIGHQALIYRARSMAQEMNAVCVVCSFDGHPLSLLCPENAPKPLMSSEEKLHKLERMGVDAVLLRKFTAEFAEMEPMDYLKELSEKLHVCGIVAGFNYTFGAGGRGNAEMIRTAARQFAYRAAIVDAVKDAGEPVSSTLIRRLIAEGNMERAQRLMRLPSVKL